MKKWIKWIVLGVVAVLVIGGAIVYLSLNSIVRSTVESQASSSLNLKTTLGGANLSLFGGKLSLADLRIASPTGYSAPAMFSLNDASVKVSYGQLTADPIRISEINLKGPKLVVEQTGGKFNLQAMMDQMPKTEGSSAVDADAKRQEGEPIRLIIDRLDVTDAAVVLRPGLPGLAQELLVPLPPLTLSGIGTGEGNRNGAAIKDVVMQLLTTMSAKASDSGQLPEQLKQLLNANVQQMAQQLGAEFNKQLGKISDEIGKKLPGELGGAVGGALKGVDQDASKAIEKGLGGLLGQKKEPATKPAK